jgi:hypothetical protein
MTALARRAARERKRRSRARQANGLASYLIDVQEETVAAALRIRNHLPEAAPVSHSLIRRELAEVITTWAERWVRIGHE